MEGIRAASMTSTTLNTATRVTEFVPRPNHSLFRCTELITLSVSTTRTAQKIAFQVHANKSPTRYFADGIFWEKWCSEIVYQTRNTVCCYRTNAVPSTVENKLQNLHVFDIANLHEVTVAKFWGLSAQNVMKATFSLDFSCSSLSTDDSMISMAGSLSSDVNHGNVNRQAPQKQQHLWKKKSTLASGQKARVLVDTVMKLSNEKEIVYGALDQWVAWEEEFPLIALAKALRILRQRDQWQQVIQVAKWMLSKGQGMTMGTYDTMILAFDMDGRVDEAEVLWDTICQMHTRSVPRMLFSRMISMYERHNMPKKLLEVFTDMEELGVKPDEGTMKKVAHAFSIMGLEDKHNEVLRKYRPKWKYLRFNGEQVRIRAKDM